jgi:hypothetical protein
VVRGGDGAGPDRVRMALLTLARMDAAKADATREEVNIAALLEEIRDQFEVLAVEKRQTLAVTSDHNVVVQADPIGGHEDQAGGIIWRVKDANNYYVIRANALEGNVVLYKTVEGKRSSLQVKGRMFGYGVDAKVPSRKWSTLRVEFSGKLFTVFFNGERLFEVEDETFKDAGGVGVWTKADSVTLFDDFFFGHKQ